MPRLLVFTYEYQAHGGDVLGLARAVDLGLLGDVEHNKWSDTKTGGAPVIELDARLGQQWGSYPVAVWSEFSKKQMQEQHAFTTTRAKYTCKYNIRACKDTAM